MAYTIEKLQKQVDDILKDHAYTRVVEAPGCEAWLCKAVDTNIFRFDIVITPTNIYFGGDLDPLVFRVGAQYGLPFLANHKGTGYMLEKVEAGKGEEVDRDGVIEQIMDYFWDSQAQDCRDNIKEDLDALAKEKPFEELDTSLLTLLEAEKGRHAGEAYVRRTWGIIKAVTEQEVGTDAVTEILRYLCEDHNTGLPLLIGGAYETEEWLRDELGFDEINIMMPSENTMFRLLMLGTAAERILEIKASRAKVAAQLDAATGYV